MNNDFFNISPDCEIVTTRVLNAPRETVFRAWTDPAILQLWWGPAGFTNTFHEFHPVSGGKWRFIMHGPEKGNYRNECVTKEACDKIRSFVPGKNEENFDKLEVELAKML